MKKNIKSVSEIYICPKKAGNKFRSARKFHTPLYLYGVTGIGKTALILNNVNMKKCSYYSATTILADEINIEKKTTEHTVVIDDLQSLADSSQKEAYFEKIKELLGREDIWLILISRCPFPRWLLPLRAKYIFVEIEEEDFLFSLDEQIAYIEQFGLELPHEQHQEAWSIGGGNPLSLFFYVMENCNLERTIKRQWDYLEVHVYDQWDLQLQEFFMDVSVVEEFTVQLAAMLTGRRDVEKLISQAEETGNFFEICGTNGIWRCRWPMRKSMQQRLRRRKTAEQIERLYYSAGLYYEINDQIPEALDMYEKYNDMDSISRLLTANARKNPSSGHYFELRRYYLELPDNIVENSPVLMAGLSLLQSMLMNIEESDRWYHALEKYAEEHTGSEKREARSRLLYLKIALPHTGSTGLIDIFKNADLLLRDRKAVLPEFSVTSNLPSLMNGGKDFCEWSKHDKELARGIGIPVAFVLGKYGKGLVPMALAESYLEKGQDIFEIFSLAEKGKMETDSGGKLEMFFVGVGLLAWLSVLNRDAEGAEKTLLSFRERARKDAPNLLPNIDAFLCRVHLYMGKDVADWMAQAPDESREFCTMDRFRYLTKVRIYIQRGQYQAAYCLIQQILYYAEMMKRTYIYMEATLLLAIVQYQMNQPAWKETLQECISRAEEYHFVRVLTREGPVLFQMLEKDKFIWQDAEYKNQVLTECRQMAEAYPSYLSEEGEEQIALSTNAVKILKLQAEGMASAAIAQSMKLSEATVKYHCRETYRKLGVKNKTAAIAEARRRKLI